MSNSGNNNDPTYQLINSIKITTNATYAGENNKKNKQIDTTGRINEKLSTKFNKEDVLKTQETSDLNNKVYSAAKIDEIIETMDLRNYVKKEEEDLVKLTNSNTSLITNGDIKIQVEEIQQNQQQTQQESEIIDKIILSKEGKITSQSTKTNDITVGGIRYKKQNETFINNIVFKGQTTNGIYFITNNNNITNFYYIENSLDKIILQHFNLEIPTTIQNYKIITSFIYNEYLYVLIQYIEDNKTKNKILSFNLINKINTYNDIVEIYNPPETNSNTNNTTNEITPIKEIPTFENEFIKSIVINENDVYLIDYNYIYLLIFINRIPSHFVKLLSINTEEQNPTPLINYNIKDVYNINNYIYIFCEEGYYKYDINNVYLYNYIEYIYNDDNLIHNYSYTIIDKNLQTIYFKFTKNNNIYYFDEINTTNEDPSNIKILIFPPNPNLPSHIIKDNVSHYTIENNIIYFIEEYEEDNEFKYKFKIFDNNMKKLSIDENTPIKNNVSFNSYIPLIKFNNGLMLLETSLHYNNYNIGTPLMEISGTTTYIKNLRINNNNIILAAPTVITTGDNVSNKIVTKNMVIKDYDLYITDYNKKCDTFNHYYQTSKALFFFRSEANSQHLYAYVFSSNLYFIQAPYKLYPDGDGRKNMCMISAFVYNDKLNVFIGNFRTNEVYLNIFDIEQQNNKFVIILLETYPIENNINNNTNNNTNGNTNGNTNDNTTNTNNDIFLPNPYTYDPLTIINNELFIFNSSTNKLFKCVYEKIPIGNQNGTNETQGTQGTDGTDETEEETEYEIKLKFVYINTLNLQKITIPNLPAAGQEPLNNLNYSNVKQILNINNTLYFIYNIRDIRPNLINNVYEVGTEPIYIIFVYNLNDNTSYNIYIKRELITYTSSEVYNEETHNMETILTPNYTYLDINYLHYAFINDEKIFLNILNQNDKLRGIYYLDDFENKDSDNSNNDIIPTPLKLYPLFENNAYSFTIIDTKFYVITTQPITLRAGPEIYAFNINYYNYEENVLMSSKFDEKRNYGKFNLTVPPIITENSDIYLFDTNKVYNLYSASLFSHMFSPERSIINNNIVITKDTAQLYNNLYITDNYCRLFTDPINNNDVVNKKYVDNKTNIKLEINTIQDDDIY